MAETNRILKILFVEDSEDDAMLIQHSLRKEGQEFIARRVETSSALKAALAEPWDCIISDFSLPNFTGPAALAVVKEMELDIPFIVVSGTVGEETAVETMKAGAHDYLMKDRLTRLLPVIQREVREAEQRKKRREAELEARKAEALKSQFMANISHEIRTPLYGVLGLADLLLQTELTHDQSEFVQTIVKSGKVLLNIVNDILDFSKIENGNMKIGRKWFSIADVVKTEFNLFSYTAKKKKLSLTLKISSDLPKKVSGDPYRLGQVLSNLISNAIKFSKEGTIEVRVDLDGKKNPSPTRINIKFSVTDAGIGIEAATQSKIFRPFFQVDGTTHRENEGTGLGLSISHRLVVLMEGAMHVESKLGEGSTFSFTIPFYKRHSKQESDESE